MRRKRQLQVSNKIKISSMARKILLLFAVALLALGSGNLIKALTSTTQIMPEGKELYKYTNKLKTEEKVNLRANEYIKEEEITEDQTYISDLISNIDLNLKYNYKGTEKTDLKYKYKIESIVSATYKANNKSYDVLNKVETIKQSDELKLTDDNIEINENLNVNYSKYHQMVKNFKQEMGITIESHLYIRLTVDTTATVDSKEIKNEYVSNYDITVGDKVAIITYKDEEVKEDSVKYEVLAKDVRDVKVKDAIISVAVMVAGIILLRFILTKTEELKTIKNEFKLELNRIMRSCESKLVEIEDLKHLDIENATRVKDIAQLLKLSDEALVPIYCYIKEEPEQEAYFIVTKYEKSYIFILK